MGIVITGISILGIIVSSIALLVTQKYFARQRKELLESIEME